MEMRQCNYCGRIFEKKYETCPGCGANSFKFLRNVGTKRIDTPPEGGYTIPKLKYPIKIVLWIFIIVGGFLLSVEFLPLFISSVFFASQGTSGFVSFSIIYSFIPVFFIIIGIIGLVFIRRDKMKKKHLCKCGILIKNMDYKIVDSGTSVNGKKVQAIEVIYENETGVKIPITSDPKYDNKLTRKDGKVDLLIDPKDLSNYYIGVDIY